jgi:uncharacterized membrane protein YeaQ/YmgE (transglycosylase-associated protein family)
VANIIWIIVIGFIAGIIARFVSPGPNRPKGFILTTGLGIAGAFVATFIDHRLVPARPGRGSHRRDRRRATCAVHLEPAGYLSRCKGPRRPARPGRAAAPPVLGIFGTRV